MLIALVVGWFGYLVYRDLLRKWAHNPTLKPTDLRAGEILSKAFLLILVVASLAAVAVEVGARVS